jgi:IclR family pca regulon transcriptional regulator
MPEQTVRERPATDRDVVHSLVRGLEVVRAFDAAHPALTLDEASERTGISRSAVRRLLRTLLGAGLVAFDGRRYRLTAGLLDLGYAQQSRLTLTEVAGPHCAELAQRIGRTVSLGCLDGRDVVYVVRVGAPTLMHISLAVGVRLPAHVPALGRVQLAALDEAALADYLRSETYRANPTPTTATPDQVRAELATIRERGWAYVAEELEAGLSAIAAPVRDRAGRVVAGLNVSTRSDGRSDDRELTDAVADLLGTAAAIGADLHPSHLA